MKTRHLLIALLPVAILITASTQNQTSSSTFFGSADTNSQSMIQQGRHTFRFDTFGDEAFWGGKLQLHRAIEGQAHGGVGPGVSPTAALGVGLKVDATALPGEIVSGVKAGKVDLADPATTI